MSSSSVLPAKKLFSKWVNSPLSSARCQFVRVYYDPNNSLQIKDQFFESYEVNQKTTADTLLKNWYSTNRKVNKKQSKNHEDFMILFLRTLPFQQNQTISQLKSKLGITSFDKQKHYFIVYPSHDHIFIQNQSNLSYKDWLKNHNLSSEKQLTIKILSKNGQDNFYFYHNYNQSIKLGQLKQVIEKEIKQKKLINNNQSIKDYKILLKESKMKKQFLQQLKDNYQDNYKEDEQYINLTVQKDQFQISQQIGIHKIFYVKYNDLNKLNLKSNNNNVKINIVSYKNLINPQDQSFQKLSIKQNKVIEKNIITRNYFQIQNVTLQTILLQQNFQDPHFTSLKYNQHILRPFQYFNKLSKLINFKQEKQINLVCIPQNLLYYKEMNQITKKNLLMDNILNLYQKQCEQNQNQKIQNFRNIINTQRNQLIQRIQQQHLRNPNFIDPIILYTSDCIYSNLNKFLRQNSISRLNDSEYDNKPYYLISQKIYNSLTKLSNYNNKVYRGSCDYDYNYKKGQIVEWNQFISTSKQKQKAQNFIQSTWAKGHLHLFQIQSYSGKLIKNFSLIPEEQQVLLLPYTKFYVQQIKQIQNKLSGKQDTNIIKYVKLLELPIPKKIPGHIIVWIDANIQENLETFDQIVSSNSLIDFDLIQLVSNDHLRTWLTQYKQLLLINDVKVHFISNMNRPPNYNQEGIQTLQIIRSFNQNSLVLYYIGNVQKTKEFLKHYGKQQDQNIIITNSYYGIKQILVKKFDINQLQKYKIQSN